MQLLNVNKAQSVWLFDANDLNPKGKFIFSDLIEWVREEYEFQSSPKSPEDLDDTKGLSFKSGAFRLGSDLVMVELKIYTDGLIANSYSSTEATDLFLREILSRAAEEFGLTYAETMIRSKTYLSELTVKLDGSFSNVNPKLASFAEKLTAAQGRHDIGPFEPSGLTFWADASRSALKVAAFGIERRINAPFHENRYYARCALPTEMHLKFLQEFEQTFLMQQ